MSIGKQLPYFINVTSPNQFVPYKFIIDGLNKLSVSSHPINMLVAVTFVLLFASNGLAGISCISPIPLFIQVHFLSDKIISSRPSIDQGPKFKASPFEEQQLMFGHKDQDTTITGKLQPEKTREYVTPDVNLTRQEIFPFQFMPIHLTYLGHSENLLKKDKMNYVLQSVLQGDEIKVLLHKMML